MKYETYEAELLTDAVTSVMPLWGLLLMFGGAFVFGFLTG